MWQALALTLDNLFLRPWIVWLLLFLRCRTPLRTGLLCGNCLDLSADLMWIGKELIYSARTLISRVGCERTRRLTPSLITLHGYVRMSAGWGFRALSFRFYTRALSFLVRPLAHTSV